MIRFTSIFEFCARMGNEISFGFRLKVSLSNIPQVTLDIYNRGILIVNILTIKKIGKVIFFVRQYPSDWVLSVSEINLDDLFRSMIIITSESISQASTKPSSYILNSGLCFQLARIFLSTSSISSAWSYNRLGPYSAFFRIDCRTLSRAIQ